MERTSAEPIWHVIENRINLLIPGLHPCYKIACIRKRDSLPNAVLGEPRSDIVSEWTSQLVAQSMFWFSEKSLIFLADMFSSSRKISINPFVWTDDQLLHSEALVIATRSRSNSIQYDQLMIYNSVFGDLIHIAWSVALKHRVGVVAYEYGKTTVQPSLVSTPMCARYSLCEDNSANETHPASLRLTRLDCVPLARTRLTTLVTRMIEQEEHE